MGMIRVDNPLPRMAPKERALLLWQCLTSSEEPRAMIDHNEFVRVIEGALALTAKAEREHAAGYIAELVDEPWPCMAKA